ncbi:hypothetical protein EVAR_35462_1 [Eumeta japonica]|uniref:Uncharacterized protein n=1 Tax=Eumeta variegata TaxID=151549 RepID=A0A4C1XK35_EUMVA|nr:hypothetical protein EVAR_35462_1 [Eumeta japonica]
MVAELSDTLWANYNIRQASGAIHELRHINYKGPKALTLWLWTVRGPLLANVTIAMTRGETDCLMWSPRHVGRPVSCSIMRDKRFRKTASPNNAIVKRKTGCTEMRFELPPRLTDPRSSTDDVLYKNQAFP